MRFVLVLSFALIRAPGILHAQEIRASIAGRISDPSGAAVPTARVRCTDVAKNVSTNTQTNEIGRYACLLLPPGPYTVTVEAYGFKRSDAVHDVA
jgi:Carboxypeptidase regulatory-like domain